jgi:DNA-3-methyladenine glycosylase
VKHARLPTEWFRRDVVTVAQDLVGTILVHGNKAGVIVETEAYLGPEDLASHTRFGPTARNAVMFGPGGVSYVYLCYGIHEMFNIVTGEDGQGQAVLIRAIAPYAGLPDDPAIGRGPGKVTKALAIDRSHDRKNLAKGPLYVAAPAEAPELAAWTDVPARAIATGPRIGVDFAGEWAARPYRFWWNAHPSVSRSPSRGGVVATRSTRRKR